MNVSPSLFGERKLIEVEGLEAMNDAFLADALKYVAAPGTGCRSGPPPRRGSPRQEAVGRHQGRGWPVVDCQPLKKDAEKIAFVTAEFKAASRRIEPEAVHALVNAVGANLAELAAACSQLIADATTAVDATMVDKLLRRPDRGHGLQGRRRRDGRQRPAGPLHTSACPRHRRGPGTAGGGAGMPSCAPLAKVAGRAGFVRADRQAAGNAAVARRTGPARRPALDAGGPGPLHPGHGRGGRAGQRDCPGILSTLWSMPSR